MNAYCISSFKAKNTDSYQPKSWDIFASNDGIKWINIDHRENVQEMHSKKACVIFYLPKPTPFFTYFKIVQLENFYQGKSALVKDGKAFQISYHHIEFFGTLEQN